MADSKRLQTNIDIQKFDGKHESFVAWAMIFKSIMELEGLSYFLEMGFLANISERSEELNPENADHRQRIKWRDNNNKAYALMTSLISGKQMIGKFSWLQQLYQTDKKPPAACCYCKKIQKIYQPEEETDQITIC